MSPFFLSIIWFQISDYEIPQPNWELKHNTTITADIVTASALAGYESLGLLIGVVWKTWQWTLQVNITVNCAKEFAI